MVWSIGILVIGWFVLTFCECVQFENNNVCYWNEHWAKNNISIRAIVK